MAFICFDFWSCQGKQLWNGLFNRHSLPDAPIRHYIYCFLQMENEHWPCTCDVRPVFCICRYESATGIPHHRLRGYHGIRWCSVMILQPMTVLKDLAFFFLSPSYSRMYFGLQGNADLLTRYTFIWCKQISSHLEKRGRICVNKPV